MLRPESVMSNTTVRGIPGSFFAYLSSQKAIYFFLSMTVFASLTCSFTLNQTKTQETNFKLSYFFCIFFFSNWDQTFLVGKITFLTNKGWAEASLLIEQVHTEFVALFVVAMEVDSPSFEHPSGNSALINVWNTHEDTHYIVIQRSHSKNNNMQHDILGKGKNISCIF